MWIEELIKNCLPIVITILELIGIFVVTVAATQNFWHYLGNTFMHKNYAIQFELANGLATGLEFKMAAEILKTVLVRDINELIILGAIIILRALLSFLIHFELKNSKHE